MRVNGYWELPFSARSGESMLTLMVRQIAQKTGVMQILRWTHTDGLVNQIWATGMGHYHQSKLHHKNSSFR